MYQKKSLKINNYKCKNNIVFPTNKIGTYLSSTSSTHNIHSFFTSKVEGSSSASFIAEAPEEWRRSG